MCSRSSSPSPSLHHPVISSSSFPSRRPTLLPDSAEACALDRILCDPKSFHHLALALDHAYTRELGAFWADLMWLLALPTSISQWHIPHVFPHLLPHSSSSLSSSSSSSSSPHAPSCDPNLTLSAVHHWALLSPMARSLSHAIFHSSSFSSSTTTSSSPPPPPPPHSNTPSPLPLNGPSPSPSTNPSHPHFPSLTASIGKLIKRAWGSTLSSKTRYFDSSKKKSTRKFISSPFNSHNFPFRQLTQELTSPTPPPTPDHAFLQESPGGSLDRLLSGKTSAPRDLSAFSPSWISRKLGSSPVITSSGPTSVRETKSAPCTPTMSLHTLPIHHPGKHRPNPLNLHENNHTNSSCNGSPCPPRNSSLRKPSEINGIIPPIKSSDGIGGHHDMARHLRSELIRRYLHHGARNELNLTNTILSKVTTEWDRHNTDVNNNNNNNNNNRWDSFDQVLIQVAMDVRRMIRDSSAWNYTYQSRHRSVSIYEPQDITVCHDENNNNQIDHDDNDNVSNYSNDSLHHRHHHSTSHTITNNTSSVLSWSAPASPLSILDRAILDSDRIMPLSPGPSLPSPWLLNEFPPLSPLGQIVIVPES